MHPGQHHPLQSLIRIFVTPAFSFFLIILASGCGLKTGGPAQLSDLDLPNRAHISSVPFYAQKTNQCGPASLAMILAWSGLEIPPAELKDAVYTPGRQGSLQPALKSAARRRGRLAYELSGMRELLPELAAGHPVLVLQNLGLAWFPQWHYAVAIGYDLQNKTVHLHSGRDRDTGRDLDVFRNTWQRSEYWGLLVLKPVHMPVTADQGRYMQAVLGLEQAGQWEAAAQGYGSALSRWPQSLTAAMGRGNCLYRLGELHKAEEVFRRAIEVHPQKPEPYNNLAHILMDQGQLQQARTVARQAVRLGGKDNEVFTDTLQEIKNHLRSGS